MFSPRMMVVAGSLPSGLTHCAVRRCVSGWYDQIGLSTYVASLLMMLHEFSLVNTRGRPGGGVSAVPPRGTDLHHSQPSTN